MLRIRTLLALAGAALLWLPAHALAAEVPRSARLDDAHVARAIDNQYFLSPSVDANRIDVRVNDGIVELTGSVRDLLEKERATEIAELVKGVRAVSNRIRVEPAEARSDAAVRKDVESALLRDPATDSYELAVAVDDGIVKLTGTVESWAEKQLSERVAKGVKGVLGVLNGIDVRYPDTPRPDAEVKAEVERRLDWDVLVDGYLVDVAVDGGAVTLTGSVGSAAEKRQAEGDAWKAGGVTSVDVSGLEVQWWADDPTLRDQKYVKRPDEAIERAVQEAALYDPRVSSFQIEADASSGWVTLRGGVDNLEAKKAAEQLARNTVGVTGVTNQVKVRLPDGPTDDEIEAQVEAAVLVNPITESYEVDVEVEDGWVTLSGLVDSLYEKLEAEDEAAKVTGVVAVRNRLDVAQTLSHVVPYYSYPWFAWPATITVAPPPPSTGDPAIRSQIESELLWSPFVDADQVDVEVERGVATLMGEVDSWREFYAASDNAYEGGAVAVINRLDVKE